MGNTVGLIKKYLRPSYIETGCSHGDGILRAFEAGIKIAHGIEINVESCMICIKRTKKSRTTVCIGSSEKWFWKVLRSVPVRSIVFLDAHKVGTYGGESYPLRSELIELSRCKIKNHTIMIDDVRLLDGELGLPLKDVIELIRKINPKYKIAYEDSNTDPKDVLVAYI